MAGLGATYAVSVEFGLKNRMAQGVRAVQAQMRGIQAQVNTISKRSQADLQRIQQHATRYGTIFGNPRSFEETKKNLATIQRQRMRYQNQLAVASTAAERQALQSKMTALDMTKRDLQAKLQGYQATVNTARSQERMARMADRERKEEEKALRRRGQMYRNIGGGAFRTAEYSGIGAAGLGFGLFEAWKSAAQQQQLATTTAMVLGYKGGAQAIAANELFKSQLKNSMAVGLLSSADIAAIQTQLAMHVPGLGMGNLLTLTPLVSKFADVMKMTKIPGAEDPAQSAAVAAMIANVFNARNPAQMRKILEQFFVMEQSTGADVQTSVNAISQYGAMGKALGFTPQDMIDLYGAMFRMGAGKGKVGARLGTLLSRIGSVPTSVMRAWGSKYLGLVDDSGVPNILKEQGGPSFDAYLKVLARQYQASIHKFGPARGKAMFLAAMTGTYGATGEKVLFPLIQSGSIANYEAQIKRHQQFATIEQAQATFFNLPINQWKRFMTNLQTLIIAFGSADMNKFGEFFKYWADTFGHWTEWMQSHQAQTKAGFDTLIRIAETLAAVSAAAFTVGTVAKIAEGILAVRAFVTTLGAGQGVLAAYLAATGRAAIASNALSAAEGKAAGSSFWKLFGAGSLQIASFLGATSIAAVAASFWYGLYKNAKMGTQGIPKGDLHGVFGNNNAFPGPYNIFTGEAIKAPGSTHGNPYEINVYVGNKKIVPDTIRVLNKGMRGGIHSTTTGQGTRFMSPIETLNEALHPHVY